MSDLSLAGRPVWVGSSASRVEDDRLLTGRAAYVADLRLSGMVEMTVARSQLAHARIDQIEVDQARRSPGVLDVVTAADLGDVRPFPDFFDPDFVRPVAAFPLARHKVRFVGQGYAAVVAEDRYLAEDAAELVISKLSELPAVASFEAATTPGAQRLYEDWPDNLICDSRYHNPEVERVLAESRVIRRRYSSHRHTAIPMETRGSVAQYAGGRLTLWTGNQSPHILRTVLALMLPVAERDIRVIVPDVGGSFGCKTHVYPEDVLVCWLAMRLGRPVRWIEDRAEHMVATSHAREQVIEIEAGVGEDGTIQAVRAHVIQDVGSGEILPPGIAPSFVSAGNLCGPYRIPHVEVSVTCAVTNKTPSGAFRGYGAPEAVFALERLVDEIAVEVGVDRVELRRRMLLDTGDLPYTTGTGVKLDSGSFTQAFDRVVELTEAAAGKARERLAGEDGARVGVGYATYLEGTTPTYYSATGYWASYDSAAIRVDPDGGVVVAVGVTTTGQGVTTMVATLAADALGVDRRAVRVHIGDTDLCPYGLGGWGSRSTVAGGGAVLKAATQVRAKILAIAGHLLEADPADLVIEAGMIHPVGVGSRAISLAEVAAVATVRTVDLPEGMDPGLQATAIFDPPGIQHRPDALGRMNASAVTGNATHGAVVKVTPATGELEILHYVAVHDCGPMVNPVIVDGQIRGGIAQGIGGAIYEHLAYRPDGQPLVGNFMDYLVPSATEVPTIEVEHFHSPSPSMPLGLKGVGEGGIIGPPAALANAVADALADLGIQVTATPLTPAALRWPARPPRPPV